MLGKGELGPRMFVVEVAPIKKVSPGEMGFACIRPETNHRGQGRIGSSEPRRGVVEAKEIEVVMRRR